MIYLYDDAIVEDLNQSFNPDVTEVPSVKVIDSEQLIGVIAQIKEDKLNGPLVSLERVQPVSIDTSRSNYTARIPGVPKFFEKETNMIWNEHSLPIDLKYTLTVLTTNQHDMDEIIRELLFKFESMYFLDIKVPYEGNRVISFGVAIDYDDGIKQDSGISQYSASGQLYQSSITLKCEGCVLLNYTPTHLKRSDPEVQAN